MRKREVVKADIIAHRQALLNKPEEAGPADIHISYGSVV